MALATDRFLGRRVAIKFLTDHSADSADSISRLRREGKILLSLSHPNIVRSLAFGNLETPCPLLPSIPVGTKYLVMDYVNGRSLDSMLHELTDADQITDIVIGICSALEYAHKRGIVHRDLNPRNILLKTNDRGDFTPQIIDFGLAQLLPQADLVASQRLTNTGIVVGSPHYMSPEQCMGLPTDGRTDVYAFGCIIYQILSGSPPFAAATFFELMYMHVHADIKIPFVREEIHGDVTSLVSIAMRCLEKEPESRYQTCQDILCDLQRSTSLTLPQQTKPKAKRNQKGVLLAAICFLATVISLPVVAVTIDQSPVLRSRVAEFLVRICNEDYLLAASSVMRSVGLRYSAVILSSKAATKLDPLTQFNIRLANIIENDDSKEIDSTLRNLVSDTARHYRHDAVIISASDCAYLERLADRLGGSTGVDGALVRYWSYLSDKLSGQNCDRTLVKLSATLLDLNEELERRTGTWQSLNPLEVAKVYDWLVVANMHLGELGKSKEYLRKQDEIVTSKENVPKHDLNAFAYDNYVKDKTYFLDRSLCNHRALKDYTNLPQLEAAVTRLDKRTESLPQERGYGNRICLFECYFYSEQYTDAERQLAAMFDVIRLSQKNPKPTRNMPTADEALKLSTWYFLKTHKYEKLALFLENPYKVWNIKPADSRTYWTWLEWMTCTELHNGFYRYTTARDSIGVTKLTDIALSKICSSPLSYKMNFAMDLAKASLPCAKAHYDECAVRLLNAATSLINEADAKASNASLFVQICRATSLLHRGDELGAMQMLPKERLKPTKERLPSDAFLIEKDLRDQLKKAGVLNT